VRAFTQDDAHIFITEEQIAAEVIKVNDLILSIYQDFGFDDVRIKFSDRPEKRIGEDAVWGKAEAALMQALEASTGRGRSTRAKAPSTAPSSNTCYVTPSAATGSAAPCRSISTCRPARRVLYRRAFEQGHARDAAPRHVRLAGAL